MLLYAYEVLPHAAQSEALRATAYERLSLAASLYESTHKGTQLNGSRTWPDYFWRNVGVSFSQLVQFEHSQQVCCAP